MKEQLSAPAKAAIILLWLSSAAELGSCGDSLTSEFAPLATAAEKEAPSGTFNAEPSKAPVVTGSGKSAKQSPADKQAARAAAELASVATPGNSGYKIGPLDVIEFSVFKAPELARTAQVADTGTVNLPLVGEVQAAGRTAQEVERELTKKLGAKYLQSPQVTILIKEYNSRRVTIEGAVKKPGVYPVRGKTSLLEVLALAEGIDREASDSTVLILRQIDGKRAVAQFDITAIRSGQTKDPIIQAGDVIVAPTSFMKETFNNIIKVSPITSVFRAL